MKIALAQINPTIGDFKNNAKKIYTFINLAKDRRADLIVFPELSITGYPPKDLLDLPAFIDENLKVLHEIASHVSGISAIIGFVDKNKQPYGKLIHNAAAFIQEGKIISIHHKSLLPTYDVFDECRYFEPAHTIFPIHFTEYSMGISICEDLWNDEEFWPRPMYEIDPIEKLVSNGANIIINISSSPFAMEKHEKIRFRMFSHAARKYRIPFVFVNQVGGNDELVFDGNSSVFDASGNLIAQTDKPFEEDLLIIDMETPARPIPLKTYPPVETAYKALVTGLRDYVTKCGFRKVVIGLSGGIDSSVTAAIAVESLGKENVLGLLMPSWCSSQESINDAIKLSQNLEINYKIIPITDIFGKYIDIIKPEFEGLPSNTTEENLQARIRGNIIMAISNKFGYLVLSTGNKSELAVGYCTLYGDMSGGLALISDIPKTMVYEIAQYINREEKIIPQTILNRPPSAELRPNQVDQDDLPPYNILDGILKAYVEDAKGIDDIIGMGYDKQTVCKVIRMVNRNEYKRRQAPPGIKVTSKAFGSGRRMPIAHNFTIHQYGPDEKPKS